MQGPFEVSTQFPPAKRSPSRAEKMGMGSGDLGSRDGSGLTFSESGGEELHLVK